MITTIWISLFLALTAATVVTSVRTDSAAKRNAADLVRARELARAALHLGIHELSLRPGERTLPRDGRAIAVSLDGQTLLIAIEDERGKLDLKLAPAQHVEALMRKLGARFGLDAFDAVNLAQRAAAAIDAPRSGDPRSARLHSISALAALSGMTPELLSALSHHATVFGFGAEINPSTASREALLAIEGMDERVADQIIVAREQGRQRPAAGRAETWLTNLEGPVYTVRAAGRLTNGIEAQMTAVVGSAGIGLASRTATISILEVR